MELETSIFPLASKQRREDHISTHLVLLSLLSKLFPTRRKKFWNTGHPNISICSILSYISFPLFLQEQSFSRHFCILGRGRDISFPLYCFSNSILCFSRCFSYSFESNTFFGCIDIFLYNTFALP